MSTVSALPVIRVLLIEDEPLVAMLAEDQLEGMGCHVVATAATLAEAESAIANLDFDVAMLDVNLGGEDGLLLADALKARDRPYVITTGYEARPLARDHPGASVLTKPYVLGELEAAIRRCSGRPA